MLCGLKAGLSIGGALVAMILAAYGYDASAPVQTPHVVHGIYLTVSLYCSIPFLPQYPSHGWFRPGYHPFSRVPALRLA